MAGVLATLTDSMITALNTSPGSAWSDYSVGTDPSDTVEATAVFDPETFFESKRIGLFIIPVTVTYNRQASLGRQQIVSLNRSPVIAVCLSYHLADPDPTGLDVAPWLDLKKVLNFREEIDLFLLKRNWNWNIAAITAEPAQEIPLKKRWFLSVTEIEFEGMTC